MSMNNMPKEIGATHTLSFSTTGNKKSFCPYEPAKLQITGTTYNSNGGHSKCDILHVARFTKNGEPIDGSQFWRENQKALRKERQAKEHVKLEALAHEGFNVEDYDN